MSFTGDYESGGVTRSSASEIHDGVGPNERVYQGSSWTMFKEGMNKTGCIRTYEGLPDVWALWDSLLKLKVKCLSSDCGNESLLDSKGCFLAVTISKECHMGEAQQKWLNLVIWLSNSI